MAYVSVDGFLYKMSQEIKAISLLGAKELMLPPGSLLLHLVFVRASLEVQKHQLRLEG